SRAASRRSASPPPPRPSTASSSNRGRMSAEPTLRRIRSFVLRQGRMTHGQERALAELLPRFAVPEGRIEWHALFGRDAHRTLEIGFGDGHNLAELARRHPEWD